MTEPAPPPPLPQLSSDNEFFWTSGRDGRLRILRCGSCGYFIHPPSPRCPKCLGSNLEPRPVSGRATVFSYTVNHQPWMPGAPVPYVVGLVELPEQDGLRLTTNLVQCDLDELHIGLAVEVTFEHYEDVWLPMFRPRQPPGSNSGT
jgi:uncharacterized OB-fold protein